MTRMVSIDADMQANYNDRKAPKTLKVSYLHDIGDFGRRFAFYLDFDEHGEDDDVSIHVDADELLRALGVAMRDSTD